MPAPGVFLGVLLDQLEKAPNEELAVRPNEINMKPYETKRGISNPYQIVNRRNGFRNGINSIYQKIEFFSLYKNLEKHRWLKSLSFKNAGGVSEFCKL